MQRWKQRIGLKDKEEERIIRVLSALPRTSPEINITPTDGEERQVTLDLTDECSLPPEVGAQGFYADYDAQTREFMEATLHWNRRKIRVNHIWYLDQYKAGGAFHDDNRFHVCWYCRCLYRATSNDIRCLDEDTGKLGEPVSRFLLPNSSLTWTNENECSGPEEGGAFFVGNAAVRIGDTSFDCIRALEPYFNEYDPEDPPEPDEPLVKYSHLDDDYFTTDGRTVIRRRFMSHQEYSQRIWFSNKLRKTSTPDDWSEWSTGRQKIIYNGIEFRHWFDILTDISLGWPAPPPFPAHPNCINILQFDLGNKI